MTSWNDLYAAAQAAGFYAAVADAELNASDTIHLEHAAPADQFEELCFATLASRLAYGTGNRDRDEAERDFFAAHGVRF